MKTIEKMFKCPMVRVVHPKVHPTPMPSVTSASSGRITP